MLPKERIMKRLNKLRVPYDSRWDRLRLSRLLDEQEDLLAVEESGAPIGEIVDVTRGPTKSNRRWPTIPSTIEEAVLDTFNEGDPCFGSLYYEGDQLCPNRDECDVAEWCQKVQDEQTEAENLLSLKKAKVTAPEILPQNNRKESNAPPSGRRQTIGPVATLAGALRMAYLDSDRKVHVAQSTVFDSYYKAGKVAFRVRVTSKTTILLMISEGAHDGLMDLMLDQQAGDPTMQWILKCYEMTGKEKKTYRPASHKVQIKPLGDPAKQAKTVMKILKREYKL